MRRALCSALRNFSATSQVWAQPVLGRERDSPPARTAGSGSQQFLLQCHLSLPEEMDDPTVETLWKNCSNAVRLIDLTDRPNNEAGSSALEQPGFGRVFFRPHAGQMHHMQCEARWI